jgi:hypothetical protein
MEAFDNAARVATEAGLLTRLVLASATPRPSRC